MANPSGTNTRSAVGRPPETSAYGDVHSVIRNQIPLLSESMSMTPEMDQNDALTGQTAQGEPEIVGENVGGSVSLGLWFEGLEYFLLAAMGFENPSVYSGAYGSGSGGSPAPDLASNAKAYCHLFECDDTLHREPWAVGERSGPSGGSTDPTYWESEDQKVRALSLGLDKTVPSNAAHKYQDSMVQKMTISLGLDKCGMSVDLVSRSHDTASDMNRNAWVLGERARALFTGLTFTIGQVASSIGAEYPIQSFEATLENNLDVAKATGSGLHIIEPIRGDGGRKVSGKFHVGRYESEQYEDWKKDGTPLQIVATLTGKAIGLSTFNYEYKFVFPMVKLTKADFPVAGSGVLTGDVEFVASKPATTRGWLTTLLGGIWQEKNNEFLVFLKNSRGACFSRDRQAAGITLP